MCIPRTALAPEPLRYCQIAVGAGLFKHFLIQLNPLLGFQPPQGLELASARCEEEKQRKKSEAKTKRKAKKRLCKSRLTCILGDFAVQRVERSEELLQQRRVAMKCRQAPDNLVPLLSVILRYFLFAAKPEVIK